MKRMSKTLRVLIPSILAMLAAFAIFLGVSGENEHECVERDSSASMLADTSERLEIIKNGKTDFVIRFASADSISIDSVKAGELSALLNSHGVYLSAIPDVVEPRDYEILIGTTNRSESQSFYDELLSATKNFDDLVWGYYIVGTKTLFTANSTDAFDYGFKSFVNYLEACSLAPVVGTKSITVMTVAEYEAALEDERQDWIDKRVEELIAMNEKFKDEPLLNGWKLVVNPETGAQLDKVYEPYKKMIGTEEEVAAGKAFYSKNIYDDPWVYPTEGDHPRYLINSTNVRKIQELVDDPEYANLFENLYALAEYDYNYGILIDRDPDGTPHDYMKPTGETYRYDETVISAITARAMMYLITG